MDHSVIVRGHWRRQHYPSLGPGPSRRRVQPRVASARVDHAAHPWRRPLANRSQRHCPHPVVASPRSHTYTPRPRPKHEGGTRCQIRTRSPTNGRTADSSATSGFTSTCRRTSTSTPPRCGSGADDGACETCNTVRIDLVSKTTGDVEGRRYIRPTGYLLTREGDQPLPRRADWRLGWLDKHIAEMREERRRRRNGEAS